MSPSDESASNILFDQILATYREQLDRGEPVDREKFIAEHGEVADKLRAYFEASDMRQRLAGEGAPSHATADPSRQELTASVPSERQGKRLALGSHVRYFGDYEILEEIARGGMGVIYKARQMSLDRLVALKVILEGDFASEEAVRRFRREAEAAAQLDHPNIVPIYEVGEHDGTHYFTMQLVDGGNLRETLGVIGREQKRAAAIMVKIARAVDYAHRCGVVHRDLKPQNVLIDSRGEPHVTDFGLARRFGDHRLTMTGGVVGTPSYMAPEQAQARGVVTTAVDVYSLGALLYHLLAGQPPFQGASTLETLRQVVDDEPRKPSELRRDLDPDLEAIVLRCLEKDPGRRFRTAAEVADDLERFLEGKPIHARPITWVRRGSKWARRHPAPLAITAFLVMLTGGAVAIVVSERRSADSLERERIRGVLQQALAQNVRPVSLASYWPSFDQDLEKRLARGEDDELARLVRDLTMQVYPDLPSFGLVSDPPSLSFDFACVQHALPIFSYGELQASWDGSPWLPLSWATCSSAQRGIGGFQKSSNLVETFGKNRFDEGPHRLALRVSLEHYDPASFVKQPATAVGTGSRPELKEGMLIARELRDLGAHRLHLFKTYPRTFPEPLAVDPGSAFRLDRVQLVILDFGPDDPPCAQIEWETGTGRSFSGSYCTEAARQARQVVMECELIGWFDLASPIPLAGEAALILDRAPGEKMTFDFAMGARRYFGGRRETFARFSSSSLGFPGRTTNLYIYFDDLVITSPVREGSYEAEFRLKPSREVALSTARIDRFFDRPISIRTHVQVVRARRQK